MSSARGLVYAILAYLMWGLFPIYWKHLQAVPPLEILCHRIAWSLIFTGLLVAFRGGLGRVLREAGNPRVALALLGTALLLGLNWLIFIYAVNNGHVVQASLGYFISPLWNGLLGVAVLRERLTPVQVAAFGLAFLGVLILGVSAGEAPWIALGLAFTFGLYGLGRKMAHLGSLEGLFLESAVLTGPALAWLLLLHHRGTGAFGTASTEISLLLAAAGAVTSVPLLFFAASARRLPLTTLGLVQYLSPTLQFLLGVLLYGEPFGRVQLASFSLIWMGLALYSYGLFQTHRNPPLKPEVDEAR